MCVWAVRVCITCVWAVRVCIRCVCVCGQKLKRSSVCPLRVNLHGLECFYLKACDVSLCACTGIKFVLFPWRCTVLFFNPAEKTRQLLTQSLESGLVRCWCEDEWAGGAARKGSSLTLSGLNWLWQPRSGWEDNYPVLCSPFKLFSVPFSCLMMREIFLLLCVRLRVFSLFTLFTLIKLIIFKS